MGDDYYVERTTKQTKDMLKRRKESYNYYFVQFKWYTVINLNLQSLYAEKKRTSSIGKKLVWLRNYYINKNKDLGDGTFEIIEEFDENPVTEVKVRIQTWKRLCLKYKEIWSDEERNSSSNS